MSRPSTVLKLEQLEDLITPGLGSFLKKPFKEVADALTDAVKGTTTAVLRAPAIITNTSIHVATHPLQIVNQPVKLAEQAVHTVTHQASETANKVTKKTEQVVHKVQDTAEAAGKKAEKIGKETKKGAEKLGKAAKDGYEEIKPVVQVAAPIVVGAVVTVYTGGNIYAGVAAASVTSSLLSGERDPKDIAVNVAKAEAVAFIGGQVAGQFAEVAADGTTVPLTTVQSVEAAAVTSVATDVVVNGETDPVVLLEHAAVAGATSYADGEVAKLNLGNTAETITTTAVNQVIQSHGHIDPQAILVNSAGTVLGTEVGEYLKPVFSGAAEPVLVPEVEEGAEQLPSPTESTSEDSNQAEASAPTDAVIPDNETGNATDSDSSTSEPPNPVLSSETGQSLHAAPEFGTSDLEVVVTLATVPSDYAELPVLSELAPSEVIVEFALPKTDTVVQNAPPPSQESWLVDAANTIQAYEDAVSKWAVDLNEDYHLTTRAGGGFDAVTGYVGTVGAILAIPVTRGATGVTTLYQADQSAAGVLTFWTGEYQPRYAEQYLSPPLDFVMGMVGTPGRAVKEGIEEGVERVGKKTLENTVEAGSDRISFPSHVDAPRSEMSAVADVPHGERVENVAVVLDDVTESVESASGAQHVLASEAKQGFATAEELSGLPKSGTIDPKSVRFSQDDIGSTFQDGRNVRQLIEDLKAGKVDANSVPAIRIVEKEGQVYTLDNRRLKAFQEAGVPIRYEKLDALPKNQLFKFTTENEGVAIEFKEPKR